MSLLDRIVNYFKEWDGIDETAPKMELSINDLRYIADMNVERCRLIKQLNEANLKTEKLLLDKTEEIRARAIEEFAERLLEKAPKNYAGELELGGITCYLNANQVKKIADQLKGGAV